MSAFSRTNRAKARLRKTFKYPSDDEGEFASDSGRDEMDEVEQETLVTSLQKQESSTNVIYKRLFTVLPVACVPVFFYHLIYPFSSSSSSSSAVATERLLSLLGVTSLVMSAGMMWFTPLPAAGRSSLHPSSSSSTGGSLGSYGYASTAASRQRQQQARGPPADGWRGTLSGLLSRATESVSRVANDVGLELDRDGPLAKSLPYLNGAVCALLFVSAVGQYYFSSSSSSSRSRTRKGGDDTVTILLLLMRMLPGIMLVVVLVARQSMAEVQRGIGKLEGLKYNYKGA